MIAVIERWQQEGVLFLAGIRTNHSLMARPLRIEYPGALYHLTSRGNRQEDIFVDDADREEFFVCPRLGGRTLRLATLRLELPGRVCVQEGSHLAGGCGGPGFAVGG